MKIALVYDRVNKWGGAERVLLALHELFPDAPLYTSVYNPKGAPWAKVFPEVIDSFLQKVPFATDRHEHFPYLMPIVFETFNFEGYDLVISVTSEAAKGIITKPETVHICYCLTPTRYLWSAYDIYFKNSLFRMLTKPVVSYLREWDKIAAQRPDILVAISTAVKKRIKKYYQRDSKVIHPPVEIDRFTTGKLKQRKNNFLLVSRLVPYKRVDLAIEAFNELGLPLVIIGKGRQERMLIQKASDNIKFVGEVSDEKLSYYYKESKALIFPQEEDFGIVALEAQAAGTPVVAFKKGGSLDTIVEGKTGIFFEKQEKRNLIEAVKRLNNLEFGHDILFENAKKFSKQRFKKEFMRLVKDSVKMPRGNISDNIR